MGIVEGQLGWDGETKNREMLSYSKRSAGPKNTSANRDLDAPPLNPDLTGADTVGTGPPRVPQKMMA
jgi:hypothetical protein